MNMKHQRFLKKTAALHRSRAAVPETALIDKLYFTLFGLTKPYFPVLLSRTKYQPSSL